MNVGIQIFIFAVSPAVALAIYFYRRDKYEKEPVEFLIRAFLGGTLMAFLAMALETIFMPLTSLITVRILRIFFISFFIAGLVEEWCKYREFRSLVYENTNFNEPFDGILYSVMISLGFATVENLAYVTGAYFKFGIGYMAGVGVSRAIFSVPGHCCFGVIMGYYLGKAKFAASDQLRSVFLLKALFYAVIVHGLFDFLIMLRTGWGVLLFFLLVGLGWNFAFKAIKEEVEECPFKDAEG